MAKFDKLFPDAQDYENHDFIGTEIFRGSEELWCWHCGKPTHWIDINFAAPLCSEECATAKWEEYFESETKDVVCPLS